ncbi:MAG: DUF1990 domain-containing protein [Jatrophihabitantaceae bacterium]
MDVQLLSESQSAQLRRRPFTYREVGRATGVLPSGYDHLTATRHLPATASFDRVTDELMSWQVQARSGLRVAASSPKVELDAVMLMRFGFGRASVAIPCRVVTVVNDVDRRGFAYGTLTGHPESGEEAFILTRNSDGGIDFTITAFSHPASALARAGGPVTKRVQHWMTNRYLRAIG